MELVITKRLGLNFSSLQWIPVLNGAHSAQNKIYKKGKILPYCMKSKTQLVGDLRWVL